MKSFKQFLDEAFSDKDKEASRHYTAWGYGHINPKLRNMKHYSPRRHANKVDKQLSHAIRHGGEDTKAEHDMHVTHTTAKMRALRLSDHLHHSGDKTIDHFQNLVRRHEDKGVVHTRHRGYTSTTTGRTEAEKQHEHHLRNEIFGNREPGVKHQGYSFHIHVPRGAHVINYHRHPEMSSQGHHEGEVLLHKNAKFRIHRVHHEHDEHGNRHTTFHARLIHDGIKRTKFSTARPRKEETGSTFSQHDGKLHDDPLDRDF